MEKQTVVFNSRILSSRFFSCCRRVNIISPRTLRFRSRPVWLHSRQAEWWCWLGKKKRTHPDILHWAQRRPHQWTRWASSSYRLKCLHVLMHTLGSTFILQHWSIQTCWPLIHRILPAHGGVSSAAWSEHPAAVSPSEGLQGSSVSALLLPHVWLGLRPAQRSPRQGWRGRVVVATERRAEHRLAEGQSRVSVWDPAPGQEYF